MTYYIYNGNIVNITDQRSVDIRTELEPANYVVKYDERQDRYFLEHAGQFTSLPKYYGRVNTHVKRIHNTFADRPNATGVMLAGEKGSGKTLLAKELAITGYALGIPTLLINQPWAGDTFNKFLTDIDQPCIVIFDEFEKIYDEKRQAEVLTLFDGVYPSKKLFIVSCNDTWKINSHMRNRPGRFYYYLTFEGLEEVFIREYCVDNGLSEVFTNQVCNFAALFNNFNFDMLKAIVEESNRYGESPAEVIAYINARPESDQCSFDVSVFVDGRRITKGVYPTEFNKNPIGLEDFGVSFYMASKPDQGFQFEKDPNIEVEEEEDGEEYVTFKFTGMDLSSYDQTNGKFVFKRGSIECHLTRKAKASYDWSKIL